MADPIHPGHAPETPVDKRLYKVVEAHGPFPAEAHVRADVYARLVPDAADHHQAGRVAAVVGK